jgi:thioredoxin-dependent peroxiredoxin
VSELTPGDPAPSFSLKDQHGGTVSLEDSRGRTLLVYFYPEADTPGCTTQSCAVRDARRELTTLGVDVVGISPDQPEEQAAFDRKFSLGFPLLSDPDHTVAEAWGAWGERKPGSVGIIRSSFLVEGDGRIVKAWYRVKPEATVPLARDALAARA